MKRQPLLRVTTVNKPRGRPTSISASAITPRTPQSTSPHLRSKLTNKNRLSWTRQVNATNLVIAPMTDFSGDCPAIDTVALIVSVIDTIRKSTKRLFALLDTSPSVFIASFLETTFPPTARDAFAKECSALTTALSLVSSPSPGELIGSPSFAAFTSFPEQLYDFCMKTITSFLGDDQTEITTVASRILHTYSFLYSLFVVDIMETTELVSAVFLGNIRRSPTVFHPDLRVALHNNHTLINRIALMNAKLTTFRSQAQRYYALADTVVALNDNDNEPNGVVIRRGCLLVHNTNSLGETSRLNAVLILYPAVLRVYLTGAKEALSRSYQLPVSTLTVSNITDIHGQPWLFGWAVFVVTTKDKRTQLTFFANSMATAVAWQKDISSTIQENTPSVSPFFDTFHSPTSSPRLETQVTPQSLALMFLDIFYRCWAFDGNVPKLSKLDRSKTKLGWDKAALVPFVDMLQMAFGYIKTLKQPIIQKTTLDLFNTLLTNITTLNPEKLADFAAKTDDQALHVFLLFLLLLDSLLALGKLSKDAAFSCFLIVLPSNIRKKVAEEPFHFLLDNISTVVPRVLPSPEPIVLKRLTPLPTTPSQLWCHDKELHILKQNRCYVYSPPTVRLEVDIGFTARYFCSNADYIFCASDNKMVRIAEDAVDEPHAFAHIHAICVDQNVLVVCCERAVHFMDANSMSTINTYRLMPTARMYVCAVHNTVWCISDAGKLFVFDMVGNLQRQQTITTYKKTTVTAIHFNGVHVVVGNSMGTLTFLTLQGKEVKAIHLYDYSVEGIVSTQTCTFIMSPFDIIVIESSTISLLCITHTLYKVACLATNGVDLLVATTNGVLEYTVEKQHKRAPFRVSAFTTDPPDGLSTLGHSFVRNITQSPVPCTVCGKDLTFLDHICQRCHVAVHLQCMSLLKDDCH